MTYVVLYIAGILCIWWISSVGWRNALKKSLSILIPSALIILFNIKAGRLLFKSPIVGTAYLAPEPGAKPFVSVGKKIKKGETIMIVEAMKTMNHVPSTSDGVVKEICVEDGQPVEFDQKIVILE